MLRSVRPAPRSSMHLRRVALPYSKSVERRRSEARVESKPTATYTTGDTREACLARSVSSAWRLGVPSRTIMSSMLVSVTSRSRGTALFFTACICGGEKWGVVAPCRQAQRGTGRGRNQPERGVSSGAWRRRAVVCIATAFALPAPEPVGRACRRSSYDPSAAEGAAAAAAVPPGGAARSRRARLDRRRQGG